MVGAVLVAELVDEQAHHVFGDALLKPVRAKPELVEDQFAAGAVRGTAQMVGRGAELHHNPPRQYLFSNPLGELGNGPHPVRPFRFGNPVLEGDGVGIVLASRWPSASKRSKLGYAAIGASTVPALDLLRPSTRRRRWPVLL